MNGKKRKTLDLAIAGRRPHVDRSDVVITNTAAAHGNIAGFLINGVIHAQVSYVTNGDLDELCAARAGGGCQATRRRLEFRHAEGQHRTTGRAARAVTGAESG